MDDNTLLTLPWLSAEKRDALQARLDSADYWEERAQEMLDYCELSPGAAKALIDGIAALDSWRFYAGHMALEPLKRHCREASIESFNNVLVNKRENAVKARRAQIRLVKS